MKGQKLRIVALLALLLILGIGLGAYAPYEWPKFHHDLHNTGYINAQGVITTPGLRWLYPSGNVIWSSPAIGDIDADGKAEVVIGSNGHAVYAIDGYSGALEWQFATGEDVWSSPAIRDVDGIQQIGWPGKSGIEPGSVAIIQFQTRLVEGLPSGTGIYNQGRINWVQAGAVSYTTFFTDDPRIPAPGDMTTVTVGEQVTPEGFYAWKTVADINGGAVQSGDRLQYTVTIVNNSHQAATGVNFSDSLASNLSLVPGSVDITVNPANCTVSSGPTVQISCSGSFPADGVAVITYEADISWTGDPPSSVCNQGLLTWSGGSMYTDDPINPASGADRTCVTPGLAIPDGLIAFKLVTDDNGGLLEPGDELTYTVVIFRHGEGGSSPYPMDLFQDRIPLNTAYVGGRVIYPLQDASFYFRSWNTDVEVVVGSIDGKLYVLEGDSGRRRWSYPTGMIEWSSAAIGDIDRDNELEIVIGTSGGDPNIGGDVYAINGTTGGLEWHYHVDSIVWSSPAIGDIDGDDTVEVVIGTNDGQVIALNGEDGGPQWSLTIPSSRKVASSPAIGDIDGNGSMEIVIGCHDGKVYVIDGVAGTISWSFTTGGIVWSSPAIGPDGTIYVGSDDGNLYAIDGSSGAEKWHYTTGGGVWSSPAVVDIDGDQSVEIIVGSNDGYIYAINDDGTLLWRFPTGDAVLSSPAIGDIDGDGKVEVVVGSRDGNVYAIDDRTVIPDEQDIEARKVALDNSGDSYVSPNEIITYTITITNNGEGAMFNPSGPLFVDPIPANTTYVGCIAGCDGLSYNSSTSPPRVEWSGTINPGQTVTIQFNVRAAGSLEGVAQICNSASGREARITWSGGSLTLPPVCLPVRGGPDGSAVMAYKTVEGWTGPLYNGDQFVYTITILNNTGTPITASFTDPLPGGIDYAGSCNATIGSCNGNDTSLSWSGNIPASGSVVIQYHVRIDCSELGGSCPTGELLCNRGVVSWPGGSQPTTEACIRLGTDPSPGGAEDVTAFKEVDWEGTLLPGSTLTYTIRIYNTSGSTITASFVDRIPPNTENPVCSSPLVCSDGTVTWSDPIPGWSHVELQYSVTISPGASGQICNYGQVSWNSGSLNITEPTNIICALVGSDPGDGPGSLVAYKIATWDGDGVLNPGDSIDYTITLINTGGVDLTDITVHEPLPGHTSHPSFDAPPGWTCNEVYHVVYGEEIRCRGDLASGQVVALHMRVRVGGGATGQICNFDLVEWTHGGINYTIPTNLLCIPLGTSYDETSGAIVAYKSADWEGSLRSGTTVTYTITVRNLSDRPQRVYFTDDLPSWIAASPSPSLVSGYSGSASITGAPTTGYQLTWDIVVASHRAETLSFTVTVGSSPPDPLCNYGTAEWPWDGVSANYMTVTNYLCLPLGSEPSEGPRAISAYKVVEWEDRDSNGFISRGDRLTYEFIIINTSEAPITVTITEELPGGVALSGGTSGWSCTDGRCSREVTASPGSSTWVSLIAEVNIDEGVICNFAEISWGSYIIPTNEICVPVGCCEGGYPPTPAIAAFKTAEWEGTLDTGDTLTYHITILNYGRNDVIVNIIDHLPTNVNYAGGPDGTYSVENIMIPAGESVERSFSVVVGADTEGEQICNFAEIHQADSDWIIPTNLLCITLGASYGDLTAVKTARWSGALSPGTEVTYTIRIENHSPSVIHARVIDQIPFGTYYSGGATFTQDIDIGAGATREVSFTVTVSPNSPHQICNYAVIAWPRPGLTYRKPTNLFCINIGDISGDPVEVWKTVTDDNGGQFLAGDTITYNITITNNTAENITDATFTDPIPEHTSYIGGSATASRGSIAYDSSGDRLIWHGPIPAGGTVSIAFRVQIDEGVARGTVISNQGVVEWEGGSTEEEPSDDPSTPAEDDPTVVTVFGGVVPPDDYVICAPNPVGDNGLVCWFDLPDDTARAWFKLFDVDGKLLFIYELAPGTTRFPTTGRWNPQDNLGRPLGNGLYLYLVEVLHTNGRITRSKVHKLVVER